MPPGPDAEDVVFEGPVFSVVRERWAGLPHPYDVARHVGATAVLPLTPDGDVLLVRQFRHPIRRSLLEIPAGLLDVPGEDPIACAARELLEETGYRHRWIEPLGSVVPSAGFSDEVDHLFWAGTEPQPAARPEEGIELIRRPLAELVEEARAGRLDDMKTALAVLMAAGRRPPG